MRITVRVYLFPIMLMLMCAPAAMAWPKILPYHFGRYKVPPRVYGYPLDDGAASYYGGMRYREYYAMGRGSFLADYAGFTPYYYGRLRSRRNWPYPEYHRPDQSNLYTNACVTVHVPPEAEVWLEGQRSQQTGSTRTFFSPPLAKDRKYAYQVRARWHNANGPQEQVQHVVLQAGRSVAVHFPGVNEPRPSSLPELLTPPTQID